MCFFCARFVCLFVVVVVVVVVFRLEYFSLIFTQIVKVTFSRVLYLTTKET